MGLCKFRTLASAAAFAGAALLIAPTAGAQLSKCQNAISKEHAKLASAVQKNLQKCADGAQKAIEKDAAKGTTTAVPAEAVKCQSTLNDKTGLTAAGAAPVKSAIDKASVALETKVMGGTKPKCSDGNLVALGLFATASHSAGLVSDLVVNAAVRAGIATQMSSNPESVDLFQTLGETGSCPSCGRLARLDGAPPSGSAATACRTISCSIGVGTNIELTTGAGLIPVTITGNFPVSACDLHETNAAVTSLHLTNGRTLRAAIPGVATVCLETAGGTGYIDNLGVIPNFGYANCLDANPINPICDGGDNDGNPCATDDDCKKGTCDLTNTADVGANPDECQSVAGLPTAVCQVSGENAAQGNPNPIQQCLTPTPAAPVAGGSNLAATLVLNTVVGLAGENGADTEFCSGDDTNAPGAAQTLALTTGSVSSIYFDANDTTGDGDTGTAVIGPIVTAGSPQAAGSGAPAQSRVLSVGDALEITYAAAFATNSDTPLIGENVTRVAIECEN